MAQTLMVRPYVFAASSRAARSLFLLQAQLTNPFVSAVLFTRTRTKLPSHSKDGSTGEAYGYRRSSGFVFSPVGGRSYSSPAAHMNDAGSTESPLMQSMEKKLPALFTNDMWGDMLQQIKEHLNAESVTVKDASGDGRHVCIDVVSSTFEGQSAVNRQRMVYKAIWEELQNTVHAVDQMTTRTPNEEASKK